MHRATVIGLSWRHAPPGALEAFTIPREQRAERLPALARALDARELVYLATCNRVEVGFVAEQAGPPAEQRAALIAALHRGTGAEREATRVWRTWQGEAAAEHLLLITAGLDSALVGEHEIAIQVRDAVADARALDLVGASLTPMYTAALRAAKRVRPLLGHAVGEVSLADIAVRLVRDRLGIAEGRVALIGVSAMIEHCARRFAALGIPFVVVNRTVSRADALARGHGAEARSLDEFRARPDAVAAIVLATGAREPVLSRADLERIAARSETGFPPHLIDLGVPPNVRAVDAIAAGAVHLGMDAIMTEASALKTRRQRELIEARVIVDDELTALRRTTSERIVGTTIATLRRRYRQTALEGVDRLFRRDLQGIGPAERERIRQWAETLAHRFAHVPALGLRELAFTVGPEAVERFFASTEPELAREVREDAAEPDTSAPDGPGART
jgi:glutamyl-tRNA reductase